MCYVSMIIYNSQYLLFKLIDININCRCNKKHENNILLTIIYITRD